MRRLNKKGKITLFSFVLIVAAIFIGFQFYKNQTENQTAKAAAGVVKNSISKNVTKEKEVEKPVKQEKVKKTIGNEEKTKHKAKETEVTKENKSSSNEQKKQISKEEEKKAPAKEAEKKEKQDKNHSTETEKTSNNVEKSSEEMRKPSVHMVKPSEEKVVYLTFDDGPSNRVEDLMNILDEYQAKATFFWLEPNIKRFGKEATEAVKRGFSIGLHGVTHDVKKIYASSEAVVNEMTTANTTLKQITGISTRLIRTPYGSYPYMTPKYMQAVNDKGFILWDWNVDSMDWKYRDSRYVNDVIQQVESLESKNITPVILMHDKAETINSLPKLLVYLKKQGFIFKTIDESLVPVQFK
ncbi:hypothetical protein J6TS2_36930 [Heyndrickxia sporothermodurans]|nr:hypothetical protein J6TS2_36930 [Heyndrickxia sporothermodurans]